MIFRKVSRNFRELRRALYCFSTSPSERKKKKNKNLAIEDSTVNFNMVLICFGWLACTVRCVTGGKKANSEDHLHKVAQDKQENEFHVFMATWPADASSLLNYIWYHSKIAFSLSLSLYMHIYRLHIYIYSVNLAKYLIKLYKVHRQSAGLAQTSDSITQVKEVHVLKSFE